MNNATIMMVVLILELSESSKQVIISRSTAKKTRAYI